MAKTDDSELPLRVQFIKFEAPKLHRAFTVPADYDQKSDKFVIPREIRIIVSKPDSRLQVDLKDLQAAILQFQESSHHKTLVLDTENCTWKDVFKQLDEANVRYEDTDKGGIGFLRKMWRKAGENKENIDPWLDFIPDEYGLNFVRTGMVIILQLAKQTAEHRERAQNAVVQVVDVVTKASPKRKILSSNESLKDCIQKLYVSVLDAVSVIIQYLLQKTHKPGVSVAKALTALKSKNQHKPVKRTLDHVDHAVRTVQLRADEFTELFSNLRDEIIVEGYSLQLEARTSLQRLGSDARRTMMIGTQIRERVDSQLPLIKGQNKMIREEIVQLRDYMKAESQGLEEKFKRWMQEEWARELMNRTNELLLCQEKKFEEQMEQQRQNRSISLAVHGNDEIPRSRTPIPGPSPIISPRKLMDLLQVSVSSHNDDLDVVMMEKPWFKDETVSASVSVAESLFQTSLFRQWFANDDSGLLLAEDYDEEYATRAISPMSLVCLSLIGSLVGARKDRPVVLHFFCGLHCDEDEGPRRMLESLVTQLLLAVQARHLLDLGFISSEGCLRDLDRREPRAMLFVLQGLLRQLSAGTVVYCLVDGVSWYEGGYPGHFQEEMMYCVGGLRELARPQMFGQHYDLVGEYGSSSSSRCRFKVLLTSGSGTDVCWERVVGPSERVYLGSTF